MLTSVSAGDGVGDPGQPRASATANVAATAESARTLRQGRSEWITLAELESLPGGRRVNAG